MFQKNFNLLMHMCYQGNSRPGKKMEIPLIYNATHPMRIRNAERNYTRQEKKTRNENQLEKKNTKN